VTYHGFQQVTVVVNFLTGVKVVLGSISAATPANLAVFMIFFRLSMQISE
jgi:hypothetical protein